MIQADGRHRADYKELALRKIDYPGRVVNDIEANGNNSVNAADGYPGNYKRGDAIVGLPAAGKLANVTVFHAGTQFQDGKIVTAGGRVLGVTGVSDDIADATRRAYDGVKWIQFAGAHYRRDIAARALQRMTK